MAAAGQSLLRELGTVAALQHGAASGTAAAVIPRLRDFPQKSRLYKPQNLGLSSVPVH